MSAGPDIREVGDAIARLIAKPRLLHLTVQVGADQDEYPAHLGVSLELAPETVELLQALAFADAAHRLEPLIEAAVREAAGAELAELQGRADTLTAALQAAGPSPDRVPPTAPPPAPASSPPPLAALPGGRPDDVDEREDPAPDGGEDDPADATPAAREPTPPPAARPRSRPAVRRPPAIAGASAGVRAGLRGAAPRAAGDGTAALPLRERVLATLADLAAGETLSSGELQRACKAAQPSVDKALRDYIEAGTVERTGEKGRYRYRAVKRPAGPTLGASSAPPPGRCAGATDRAEQRQDRQDQRPAVRVGRRDARRPDPRPVADERPHARGHLQPDQRTTRRRRACAARAARGRRRQPPAGRQIPGGALSR